MSATEVILEIKKLPREQQAQVYVFLREQLNGVPAGQPQSQYASDAEFEAAMDKVFKENAGLLRRLAS